MKKLFEILRWVAVAILLSPFVLAWLPGLRDMAVEGTGDLWWSGLVDSFRQLSVTLAVTLAVTGLVTLVLGYMSVLWQWFGKLMASILDSIESVPAILITLFAYAPVATMLANNKSDMASVISLGVFVFAAAITALPEAVRGITLPLGELYHRKYSVSFRAYGFTKSRILLILMNSNVMREVMRRTSASILLKTLVLDCSFGFIIQLGMGSHGRPDHSSPGALIAAFRYGIFPDGDMNPLTFWLPVALLVSISMAFLLMLGNDKEAQS